MIISLKQDGCGYDFEVHIKRGFKDMMFYQVRHAGCTIIINDNTSDDISNTAIKICKQVLKTIEVMK